MRYLTVKVLPVVAALLLWAVVTQAGAESKWFLLFPPHLDTSKPLLTWDPLHNGPNVIAWSTERRCQMVRNGMIESWTRGKLAEEQNARGKAEAWSAAQCISADDPRLGNQLPTAWAGAEVRPETRLWIHIYRPPGANHTPIAKPWIEGTLYGGSEGVCLAEALKQANALSATPQPVGGLEFAGHRRRVLQDGVVVVTYLRPKGSVDGDSPVLIGYVVCKPEAWQPPAVPDARADGREALRDAVFSFGPAAAGSTFHTIFVESALLDKHPLNESELKWCGADADCNARLSAATNLLMKATAPTGAIIYTPGRPIVVSVALNGRTTVRLVLDTGADGSMVKPAALAAAGVDLSRPAGRGKMSGVTGQAEVVSYFPVDFEVAGHRVRVPQVAAFNYNDDSADGLLGRDFLDRFKITMDPVAGTVTLVPR